MAFLERAGVPFLDCGSSDWYLPHFHSRFLKGRVSLWKAVKQHAKCELSALTLHFPCSEHRTKTSLGFIVREFESCMLLTIAHVLPEIPWLFMKSIFNRARYSLAWGKKKAQSRQKKFFLILFKSSEFSFLMLQYQLVGRWEGGQFGMRNLTPCFLASINLDDSSWLCKLTCWHWVSK